MQREFEQFFDYLKAHASEFSRTSDAFAQSDALVPVSRIRVTRVTTKTTYVRIPSRNIPISLVCQLSKALGTGVTARRRSGHQRYGVQKRRERIAFAASLATQDTRRGPSPTMRLCDRLVILNCHLGAVPVAIPVRGTAPKRPFHTLPLSHLGLGRVNRLTSRALSRHCQN